MIAKKLTDTKLPSRDTFREDNRFAEQCESLFDQFYSEHLPQYHSHTRIESLNPAQTMGDVVIFTKSGDALSVEEKAVRGTYRCIFAELKDGKADGWLWTSLARYLAYMFVGEDGATVYFWEMDAVREAFRQNADDVQVISVPVKGRYERDKVMQGALIPVALLNTYCDPIQVYVPA